MNETKILTQDFDFGILVFYCLQIMTNLDYIFRYILDILILAM